MLALRSIIFNSVFFLAIAVSLILGTPLRFFHKKYTFVFWRHLSLLLNFITSKIGGITFKIENEIFLLDKPAIYAIRHESTWETLILIHKFKDPVFVLKKELLNIPFFGAMSKKVETIEIDREKGVKALINAASKIEKSIKEGHPVIIFPEGTRAPSGESVQLKRGIALFYGKTNTAVVPVIHNSGRFWPRRGFIKKPGEITVKFLEPIAPGLSKDDFMDRLNNIFYSEIKKLKSLER